MADNITPFRPRRPPPKPARGPSFNLQSQRGKAIFVQLLVAACFAATYFLPGALWSLIGIGLGVAAVLVAQQNRADGMPWARTHHEHALRTVIIGAVAWMLLSVLLILNIGVLIPVVYWGRIAVCVWAGARGLIGAALAVMRRPMFDPKGLLI